MIKDGLEVSHVSNLRLMQRATTETGNEFWEKYFFKRENSKFKFSLLEQILYALSIKHLIKLILYDWLTALSKFVPKPENVGLR